jgi:hypothetical protein
MSCIVEEINDNEVQMGDWLIDRWNSDVVLITSVNRIDDSSFFRIIGVSYTRRNDTHGQSISLTGHTHELVYTRTN